MPGLSVTLDSRSNNSWVLSVKGRPLPEDAATLDAKIDETVASHPRLVVVDCSGLEFLGSFGIGALIRLQKAVEKQGGTVRLAGVAAPIMKILEASRLEQRMPILTTVDAALR